MRVVLDCIKLVNFNENLIYNRDLNVPLQEYLQKMHQREKKNEEAYQSIMRQMSELDQRTDLLCSKIEKLGIFRVSVKYLYILLKLFYIET